MILKLISFFIVLSFPTLSQTVVFVIDTISTKDSLYDAVLSTHKIYFQPGTLYNIQAHNFKVLDSLESKNKNWLKELDHKLSHSDHWNKIKDLNSGKHQIRNGLSYEEFIFWDFGRLKRFKICDWYGEDERHSIQTVSQEYTRKGKKKNR